MTGSSGDTPSLDSLVELSEGRTKRLGDCTADDLLEVKEMLARRMVRAEAAKEAVSKGRAPKCEHRMQDGSFCERDADFIATGSLTEGEPRSLCRIHRELRDLQARIRKGK